MKANKELNSLVTKYSILLAVLIFTQIVVTKFDTVFYIHNEFDTVLYSLLKSGALIALISNLIVAVIISIDLQKRKLFLIWIILVTLFSKELGVMFTLIYLINSDK